MKKMLGFHTLFSLVFLIFASPAIAADIDFNDYDDTPCLYSTDEFLLYRSGDGLMNWNPDFLTVDCDGNLTGPVTLTLPNLGLRLQDTDATHNLTVAAGSNLTAARTLTITTGDASRTLTLGADSSISGTAYVATGTDVALADGGTGVSLTDPNADRIMFWDDSAGAVTWLQAGTGLAITDTTLSSTAVSPIDIALHAAAGSQVTNSTSSTSFLSNSSRHVTKVDLTNYTQVRLLVKQESVSDTTAKLALRYYTSFTNTPATYLAIGTSEVQVSLDTTGVYLDSGWIDLAAGAKADVFLAGIVLTVTSGATTVGSVHAQFK